MKYKQTRQKKKYAIHATSSIRFSELVKAYGLRIEECIDWEVERMMGHFPIDYIHLEERKEGDYNAHLVTKILTNDYGQINFIQTTDTDK